MIDSLQVICQKIASANIQIETLCRSLCILSDEVVIEITRLMTPNRLRKLEILSLQSYGIDVMELTNSCWKRHVLSQFNFLASGSNLSVSDPSWREKYWESELRNHLRNMSRYSYLDIPLFEVVKTLKLRGSELKIDNVELVESLYFVDCIEFHHVPHEEIRWSLILRVLEFMHGLTKVRFLHSRLGARQVEGVHDTLVRRKSHSGKMIRRFELVSTNISDESIPSFKSLLQDSTLEFHYVSFRNVLDSNSNPSEIINTLRCSNYVRVLSLRHNFLDDESMQELFSPGPLNLQLYLTKRRKLEELDVSYNELTSTTMSRIYQDILLGYLHLQVLDVSHNPIQDEGANFICKLIQTPGSRLKWLSVYNCQIQTNGMKSIMESLGRGSCSLTSINLGWNYLGDGTASVSDMIKKNDSLIELHLNYIGLGKACSMEFAEALIQNSKILILSLAANRIANYGVNFISHALVNRKIDIYELDIGENLISLEGLRGLHASLKQRYLNRLYKNNKRFRDSQSGMYRLDIRNNKFYGSKEVDSLVTSAKAMVRLVESNHWVKLGSVYDDEV